MPSELKPLATQILVRSPGKDPFSEQRHGPNPLWGIVHSKGSGVFQVKVGDTVYFGRYCGTEIHIEGTDYIVMREDEVLLVRYEVHDGD
jgi:chaperonin GroES